MTHTPAASRTARSYPPCLLCAHPGGVPRGHLAFGWCPAGVGATLETTRLGTLTPRQRRVMRSNGGNGFKSRLINIATMSGLCSLPKRHLTSLHLTSLMPLGLRFSLERGLREKHEVQTAPNSSNIAALPFISTFHTDLTIRGQPRILFSFPFSLFKSVCYHAQCSSH